MCVLFGQDTDTITFQQTGHVHRGKLHGALKLHKREGVGFGDPQFSSSCFPEHVRNTKNKQTYGKRIKKRYSISLIMRIYPPPPPGSKKKGRINQAYRV